VAINAYLPFKEGSFDKVVSVHGLENEKKYACFKNWEK